MAARRKIHKVGDTHFGDSGKGKLIDLLIRLGFLMGLRGVARFNGGPNAGHTVKRGILTAKLHGLPTSVLNDLIWSLIAQMSVVDGWNLLDTEIPDVAKLGVEFERLRIVKETFTILPWHHRIEELEAEALGKTGRDTTMRGIGPAYRDAVGRLGITIGDLIDESTLRLKVGENLAIKNRDSGIREMNWTVDGVTSDLLALGERLRPYMVEMDPFLSEILGNDGALLLEGAQGVGLDRDSPGYPYVSCSGLTTHDAAKIFRIHPEEWGFIFGVCKAYTTSVGRRIFPTVQRNEIGEGLAERGVEFGTTTGRKRDCGWLDGVLLRHAVQLDLITHLFVTKLDVLDEEPEVKICVAYTRNGDRIELPPRLGLAGCEPVYETIPGWQVSTRGVTTLEKLPSNARRFLDRIQEIGGIPLAGVSTGPDTDETIWLLN